MVCAKCGEKPSRYFSIDKQSTQVNYGESVVTMLLFRRMSTTKTTTTYDVPVCNSCHQQLSLWKYVGMAIRGIGILLVVGAIFIAVTDNNKTSVPFLTDLATRMNLKIRPHDLPSIAMVFVGVIIAGLGVLVGLPHIVSTNGSTFKFHNKKFQAAFARLNPEKVKQTRPR